MDTLSIILLTVSAILAVALLVTFLRNKKDGKRSPDTIEKSFNEITTELETPIGEQERQELSRIVKEKSEAQEQAEEVCKQLVDLQSKYDREMAEASAKIKSLESEINETLNKGADEVVKARLAEANTLINRIKELESQLEIAKADAEKASLRLSKVEDLNKKIKSLEDELEEAEEETEEAVKNSKKLKSANAQLQDNLDKVERECKRYVQDFNETKNRLQKLQTEFDIKTEALDFITEMLTARNTQDETVKSLYQKVDTTVDYVKGEVRDVLKQNDVLDHDAEQKFFGSELESWAIAKKKTWIQGKITVAFVGEFSAGKTSIVNRILSQDDPQVPKLPVSTKATTAIPTYISGGISTYYQFVTPNNELKAISEATFKRVSKEVLDRVKGVSSLIQYFVMTYKNPYLEKMSILDTPGFSSNDEEDKERTIQ